MPELIPHTRLIVFFRQSHQDARRIVPWFGNPGDGFREIENSGGEAAWSFPSKTGTNGGTPRFSQEVRTQ